MIPAADADLTPEDVIGGIVAVVKPSMGISANVAALQAPWGVAMHMYAELVKQAIQPALKRPPREHTGPSQSTQGQDQPQIVKTSIDFLQF